MRILRLLIVLTLSLPAAFAVDSSLSAVVSNRTDRGYAVTASVRTNGCTLELWQYTGAKAHLQGYWIQHVYVGDKHLFQIQHSATEKEQSLAIEHNTGYGVLQIDRDLDGK